MFDLRNFHIGTRLLVQALSMAIWFIVLVVIAMNAMLGLQQSTESVYHEKMEPGATVLRIQSLMNENRLMIAQGLQHDPAYRYANKHTHPLTVHTDLLIKNRDEITELWKQFKSRKLSAEEEQLATAYEQARAVFVREGLMVGREALLAGDFDKAAEVNTKVIPETFAKAGKAADDLRNYYAVSGKALYLESAASYQTTVKLLIALSVFVTALVAFFAFFFIRSITQPIARAVAVADAVAGGKLDNPISHRGDDEVTHLFAALEKMQIELHERIESERRESMATLRVKTALDVSSNSVMLADPNGVVIYANTAVLNMMREAESDVRKDLPQFRADQIVGSNIDIYHKNPAHQRTMLAALTAQHKTEIKVGGRHFSLVATPIIDHRQRLGTVVEWRDRTAEVRIEGEVSTIIEAAVAGDFSMRLDASALSGFFRQLGEGINALLEANASALKDVGGVLARLSQGNLTEKISADYRGTLGELKDDANATVDNLREIVGQLKGATDAINTAAREIASGNQDLSARTEEQASSLEETASSMEQLTSTVKQNADNARQANTLAGDAQQVAEKGGQMVGQVVHTMSAIAQSSSKIADIIGVIDGIAFQTNILALNAAVEAARAGEQGRGFAVVATEVRSLAQRSAAAAKEIKELIADSVDKVDSGNKQVEQAGRTMEQVVSSIKSVARIMANISEASREQSAGIEQVSLAVNQMDEVTQQNAALVEQAAAAAESLEEQAQSLAQAVSVFVLNEEPAKDSMPALASKVEGLDFDGAIIAHRNWKRRLLEFIGGKGEVMDPTVVERDDKCALGCWIHSDGRSMQGNALYGTLKHEHAGFHQCAAGVIRQHQAGDSRNARSTIAGEFSQRSEKVIDLLHEMQKSQLRPAALSREAPLHETRERSADLRVNSEKTAKALFVRSEDEWAEF
jgi:methyl-accepting chemotaxis protein